MFYLHQFSAAYLCIGKYGTSENSFYIWTSIYSLLFCVGPAEAVEAQVVPLYYVYTLGVVAYCHTFRTTVRCFAKSAYFLWRKKVISTGLELQLRRLFGLWYGLLLVKKVAVVDKLSALLLIEFPASITFNSLSRHFCRSDKDQFK